MSSDHIADGIDYKREFRRELQEKVKLREENRVLNSKLRVAEIYLNDKDNSIRLLEQKVDDLQDTISELSRHIVELQHGERSNGRSVGQPYRHSLTIHPVRQRVGNDRWGVCEGSEDDDTDSRCSWPNNWNPRPYPRVRHYRRQSPGRFADADGRENRSADAGGTTGRSADAGGTSGRSPDAGDNERRATDAAGSNSLSTGYGEISGSQRRRDAPPPTYNTVARRVDSNADDQPPGSV